MKYKIDRIGEVYKTNEGCMVEILEKIKEKTYKNFKIKFLDEYGYETTTSISELKKGTIKNPLHKSVLGVGFLGVGGYKCSNNRVATKEYEVWASILERCYNEDFKIKKPTYKNCTVCEEWLNFQNFAKWYHENFPKHIEGVKFHIDKDLLQLDKENKIYSPETCVFLPQKINKFLTNNKTSISSLKYTGVYYLSACNKWIAITRDFELNKQIWLGSFYSDKEAKDAYIKGRKIQAEKAKQYMRDLSIYSEDIISKVK